MLPLKTSSNGFNDLNYTFRNKIGKGAHGQVSVHDRNNEANSSLPKTIAVKEISEADPDKLKEMTKRELAVQKLKHKNILVIYGEFE